ncbi:MAG TPA: ATP-binding protein, partial [Actinomycetota bacterium]|nr:ATP-binding protein [Actinomycetota bacterium]
AQGRREFVGQADQVAAARRFVVSAIQAAGPARDVTRLLVSEAATNAILHSASGDGGTFAVQYLISDHLVRVEVHDGGGPSIPRRRVHDLESMTGRGLDLFDALSDRWGVDGTSAGWTVWFELDLAAEQARSDAGR